MGHEYVEMKNSHAAIEAYRKAVGQCRFIFSLHVPGGLTLDMAHVLYFPDLRRRPCPWSHVAVAYLPVCPPVPQVVSPIIIYT